MVLSEWDVQVLFHKIDRGIQPTLPECVTLVEHLRTQIARLQFEVAALEAEADE